MAASITSRVTFLSPRTKARQFRNILVTKNSCQTRNSSVITSSSNDQVEYPPIKPRYPPGRWGSLSEKFAWKIHDEAEELLKIPTVKHRLEKIAGPFDEKIIGQHHISLFDVAPGLLKFKQNVTKTHICEGLPDIYNDLDAETDKYIGRLSPLIEEAILREADKYNFLAERGFKPYHIPITDSFLFKRHLLGNILHNTHSVLAASHPHLHRSQFDHSVRVETFWKKGGYEGDEFSYVHGRKMGSILDFKIKFKALYQIRTEMPLPEILPVEDTLCQTGEVPEYPYAPRTVGSAHVKERPISLSGHWVGDPCEFTQLCVVPTNWTFNAYFEKHGNKHINDDSLGWGLVSGFGSTVSQAYNQGFFPWKDITYPLVSQVLITDGQWFRFFVYQLNTIHLWKDNDANPTRNLMWASPSMKLFDVIENGKVTSLSKDVIGLLIKSLLFEPQDRGIDLRPYIEEPSPLSTRKLINHVGEEPIPQHKIGRYEYPRNAVYF